MGSVDISYSDYKLLLVDDIETNLLLLKAQLRPDNYQIVTASNGAEALRMVDNESPDLILLDVMMPEMNGFEVATHLRSNPKYATLPIIFLTALNSSSDIVEGFRCGGNDFVSKPFNKEELSVRIRHQLRLIAAQRTIERQTEELRNTIKGRDKLYSVIAHDLRSPMGTIKMVLNMLMLNLPAEKIGEGMFEMLSMANQTTENLFSLLDNLLKWTKSQIGRLNVVYQDFDMVEVAIEMCAVFTMTAEVKNIKLKKDLPQSLPLNADIDMVKTIVRNLISNALKYSHEGSEIILKVTTKEDFAVISIQDFGKGIKADDQTKLLNEETHFTTYGTANEEGSGLGLLLCKDFAIKNGGNLWFDSEESKGSTFYFSIPQK